MYSDSTPSRCALWYLTTPSSPSSIGPLPATAMIEFAWMPGATGVAAIAWTTGLLGVMPKRLPDPSVPGSTLKSLAFRVARSAPSAIMRRGRVMKRPTSRAAENSVR